MSHSSDSPLKLSNKPFNPMDVILRIYTSVLLSPFIGMVAITALHEISISVPITRASSILALVIGFIISVALLKILAPTFTHSGNALSASVATLIFPLLGLVSLLQSTWLKRFNFLFNSSEDNAAWVSTARSILMNHHLPLNYTETEYFSYGTSATLSGALPYLAIKGSDSNSLLASVKSATDAVLLSEITASITAVGLLTLCSAIFLSTKKIGNQPENRNAFSNFILFYSYFLAGTSALTSTPILNASFLGFSQALCCVVLLIILYSKLEALISKRLQLVVQILIFAASIAAISLWPFLIAPFVLISAIELWKLVTSRRGLQALTLLSPAFLCASLLGYYNHLRYVLKDASVVALADAAGIVLQFSDIEKIAILAITFQSIYQFARDPNGLLFAGKYQEICIKFLTCYALLFGALHLLAFSGDYALAKSLYFGLSLALLTLPWSLFNFSHKFGFNSNLQTALSVGLLVFVLSSPSFSSVTRMPKNFTYGGEGLPASHIESVALKSNKAWVCLPDPNMLPNRNYICNRWAAALSPYNSRLDFEYRAKLLQDSSTYMDLEKEFTNNGYLPERQHFTVGQILGPG